MHRIGYTRYVAQGGGVGASVTDDRHVQDERLRYFLGQATRPQTIG